MEHKLTASQVRTLAALNNQIQQAQAMLQMAYSDLDAQKQLLRKYYDMPEGEMKFRQEGQEVVMFVEEKQDEADH